LEYVCFVWANRKMQIMDWCVYTLHHRLLSSLLIICYHIHFYFILSLSYFLSSHLHLYLDFCLHISISTHTTMLHCTILHLVHNTSLHSHHTKYLTKGVRIGEIRWKKAQKTNKGM
jgi:hypothetical protein